jgi:hypothetical protein
MEVDMFSMKEMESYKIGATDGVIGQVEDFYFDDESWVIRHLVVETGRWLLSRRVLISPIALGEPNWSEKVLPASITCEQVRGSPDIDTNRPVSRQHEMGYLAYYGYPYYWGGNGLWGGAAVPGALLAPPPSHGESNAQYCNEQAHRVYEQLKAAAERHQGDDPHLRSGNMIMTYAVRATDGDLGHVAGMLVEEHTWAIRYLVINAGNWWRGHEVLVAPNWITGFDWENCKVAVDMTRLSVKSSPPYNVDTIVDRMHEGLLNTHHGQVGYWQREAEAYARLRSVRKVDART